MKLILQILLILLIVATITICALQPDMHKNVIVYDSDYTLVTDDEVKTETKDIPVMEAPAAHTTVSKVETVTKPQTDVKKTVTNNVVKTVIAPKKTVTKSITTNKQTNTVQKQNTVTKPQTQTDVTTVKTVSKPVETKQIEKQPVKTTSMTTQTRTETKPAVKTMTAQEETIAWNRWRSNIMNRIMQDTKLPDIPTGTVFQFSFTVDKYGKISNVQTGANPSNYTPYAIQYIAPVIRSYQGRSILNFPEGTARFSTQVTGKWRISNTQKYSTPQDYNDYERVTK